MAAKVLTTQAKVYAKIGDELDPVTANLDIPTGNGTLTLFRAIDGNMADCGAALVEIAGTEYAIPLLLNS